MESNNYAQICNRLRKAANPLTDWDKIKVGDKFHIPPLLVYARRHFTVTGKDKFYITGTMVSEQAPKPFFTTIYREEISAKYMVKVDNTTYGYKPADD